MEGKKGSLSDLRADKKMYPVAASDYRLMEEIGRGVSAVVYRAKCIPLSEFVAIKSLDLERCNSSLDDIRREAQTMSLISHPNVVKAYCSFVVDRSLWVVMPYMAGGSCLHIMKAAYPDGFEEAIIASFLKETLKALEYLHHHGHIHRDVKAGNILVDSNGLVKLGDFGVSACMFDTGDRQRARNTFVGTPCWMAPEVMEQLHGYDFKADIWSFGITALELAHGHAPFSKYPPMKVLLMTLQNAPPGLDYERDKRFSKSFKEMIAMCLVKDPAKRPSAEKLLKHSFFKHARPVDYVARAVLDPLPPLWERVNDLKMKDAARLAQKKMPYGEQEERSQNEYKRGVSCWNFDLEDLKAQASLNDADIGSGREEFHSKEVERKDADFLEMSLAMSPPPLLTQEIEPCQQLVTIHSLKAESATDAGERVTRVRSGPLPSPVTSKTSIDAKYVQPVVGKKEPKHIGRFDVFEDDPDQDSTDSPHGVKSAREQHEEEKESVGKDVDAKHIVTDAGKEQQILDQAENNLLGHDSPHRGCGLLSVDECAGDNDENGRDGNAPVIALDDDTGMQQLHRERSFSGSLIPGAALENRSVNGPVELPKSVEELRSQKDSLEEKAKAPVVQKKGRFSVTSHDMDLQEDVPASNTRKNASVQTSALHKSASVGDWLTERVPAVLPPSAPPQTASLPPPPAFNASLVMPQLQNLFNQTAVQQELIVNLMNNINAPEQFAGSRSSGLGNKTLSWSTSMNSTDSMGELITERERELLAQIAELQCRVTTLVDELQAVKLRNIQLERQLNAIFNKEEEERIRREEAARDDG